MANQQKPNSEFEKKLEKEAKTWEPMFWLIPKPLRIISPRDVATRIEYLELELDLRRVERMAQGKEGSHRDALYRIGRYTWFYVWMGLTIILSVALMVAAYVAWFWFLGYVIYWLFTA